MAENLGTLALVFVAGLVVGYFLSQAKAGSSSLVNEETIEWIDRKGQQRRIVVHRRVVENE